MPPRRIGARLTPDATASRGETGPKCESERSLHAAIRDSGLSFAGTVLRFVARPMTGSANTSCFGGASNLTQCHDVPDGGGNESDEARIREWQEEP